MGGLLGALGQIGEAQAGGEELRRQRDIERQYLAVQQQYAQNNLARLGLEQSREKRLAAAEKRPQYLYHYALPDGTIVQATQQPDGRTTFEKVPYHPDFSNTLKGIDDALGKIDDPKYAEFARGAVKMELDAGHPEKALEVAEKYYTGYAHTKLPQEPTITQGWNVVPMRINGVDYQVQVPYTRVTQKGVPGEELTMSDPGVMSGIPQPQHDPAGFDRYYQDLQNYLDKQARASGKPSGVPDPTGIPLPPGAKILGVRPTAGGSKGQPKTLSAEDQASLRVLKTSMFGDPTQTEPDLKEGLMGTLKVLDDSKQRYLLSKLLNATEEKPDTWFHSERVMFWASQLSPESWRFYRQLNRVRGTIGGLRSITGKMRPTEAFMQRQLRELPDPTTTTNSADGTQRLKMISQEIDQAMKRAEQTGVFPGQDSDESLPQPVGPVSPDAPGGADDPVVKEYLKQQGIQ